MRELRRAIERCPVVEDLDLWDLEVADQFVARAKKALANVAEATRCLEALPGLTADSYKIVGATDATLKMVRASVRELRREVRARRAAHRAA